jgi:hypothetical protein
VTEQRGSAAGHSHHGEFHCPGPWPVAGAELTLAAGESRHACRALRVRSGERIRLVDGEGRAGAAPVPGGMQVENIWDGYNCGFDLALLMRRVREHLVSIQRPDEGGTHETR